MGDKSVRETSPSGVVKRAYNDVAVDEIEGFATKVAKLLVRSDWLRVDVERRDVLASLTTAAQVVKGW